MKKVLLVINDQQSPYGDFSNMFTHIIQASKQFELDISEDRNSFTKLDSFDAVALYIAGGTLTLELEEGIASFVRNGGGLLAVHGSNAGLGQYETYINLIGSEFIQHDPLAPFEVNVVDDIDDILPRLNKSFQVTDKKILNHSGRSLVGETLQIGHCDIFSTVTGGWNATHLDTPITTDQVRSTTMHSVTINELSSIRIFKIS